MLDYFYFGKKIVWMYSFMINVGTVLSVLTFFILVLRSKKDVISGIQITLLMMILLEWGFFLSNYIRGMNEGEVISISEAFTVDFGGHFLGRVLVGVWVFPVIYRIVFQKIKGEWRIIFDYFSIALVIQHIFNRIACLCHGCCEGKPYSGLFAFYYPGGKGYGPGFSYSIYPTQIFEITGMIILLVIGFFCIKKKVDFTVIFQCGFAMVIFLSEFMMNDIGIKKVYGLTVVQCWAIVLFINGVILKGVLLLVDRK